MTDTSKNIGVSKPRSQFRIDRGGKFANFAIQTPVEVEISRRWGEIERLEWNSCC
jgi:hypothetical protein